MHVKSFVLENIRGFGQGRRVDISLTRKDGASAGWIVFAGRNGTGKSTLLQAIALSIAGPGPARTLEENFAGWISNGEMTARVATRLDFGKEDEFSGRGNTTDDAFWTGLRWDKSPDGPEPALKRYLSLNDGDRQKTIERGPWADNPSGWFVAGYGPFRRLSGHASDAQRLMLAPNRVSGLVSLFREDASLVESVQWLREFYLRRLERRQGASELEENVKRLLNDGLLPGGTQVTRVDSEGLWVQRDGVELPLRQMSDGYRVTASLVLDIVRQMHASFGTLNIQQSPTGSWQVLHSGVVLIDEIDVHLHVSWQQDIGFWLKEHFPRVQFLVTTHSPYVCQAADLIVRLPGDRVSPGASKVSDEVFSAAVNGTPDQAVVTELFGLDSPYSSPTEKLRRKIAHLEVLLIQGKASDGDKRELERLKPLLPSSASSAVEMALRSLEKRP